MAPKFGWARREIPARFLLGSIVERRTNLKQVSQKVLASQKGPWQLPYLVGLLPRLPRMERLGAAHLRQSLR